MFVGLTVVSLDDGLDEPERCLIVHLLLRALDTVNVVIGEFATISLLSGLSQSHRLITLVDLNDALRT